MARGGGTKGGRWQAKRHKGKTEGDRLKDDPQLNGSSNYKMTSLTNLLSTTRTMTA